MRLFYEGLLKAFPWCTHIGGNMLMNRSGRGLIGLVAVAAMVLSASACAGGGGDNKGPDSSIGFTECVQKPNSCNNGKTKAGGTITYALGKDVKAWNTLSS